MAASLGLSQDLQDLVPEVRGCTMNPKTCGTGFRKWVQAQRRHLLEAGGWHLVNGITFGEIVFCDNFEANNILMS